jgi:hypothetical protein
MERKQKETNNQKLIGIPISLENLLDYQKELNKSSQSQDNSKNGEVTKVEKTKTSGSCTEQDQASLPLAYVTGLILEKDGKLELGHDPRSGQLSLKSPDMISNCSSMIEWVSETKVVDCKKTYWIEARIRKSDKCQNDACEYPVAQGE